MDELLESNSWRALALAAVLAIVVALVVQRLVHTLTLRLTQRVPVLHAVALRSAKAARFVAPLIALQAVWQAADDHLWKIGTLRQLNALLLIASLTCQRQCAPGI